MDTGHISLIATSPHKRQVTHLGAFFNNGLATVTASISQEALHVRLSIFKNTALISHPLFLNPSIIFCISSTSLLLSFLREVKAAIKAGSEPS